MQTSKRAVNHLQLLLLDVADGTCQQKKFCGKKLKLLLLVLLFHVLFVLFEPYFTSSFFQKFM